MYNTVLSEEDELVTIALFTDEPTLAYGFLAGMEKVSDLRARWCEGEIQRWMHFFRN